MELRKLAQEYVSPETKNIAELDKVNVMIDIEEKIVKEGTPDEFSYYFFTKDDTEYRVPKSVVKQLKTLIEEKPDMTEFKVKKEGEGMKTSYTVIPL